MTPQGAAQEADGVKLARLTLRKTFSGDMSGRSEGEMLSAMTTVPGSAGYVAIERFAGTVHGREGSFVLQHSGTMDRQVRQLSIAIVPDSGTGALAGIAGRFLLDVEGGQHRYTLEYSLGDERP